MSRYLSFVILALSASSVLAAPQGFPTPDTVTGGVETVVDTVSGATGTAGGAAGAVGAIFSGFTPDALSPRAPAELPQLPSVPDTTTLTRPALGERSNGKVYSTTTLRKRDWQYPTSTKDCLMTEVPDKSKVPSYTHDGQEYFQECLSRLALSVPSEERVSCRATGTGAHGYDEQCLSKKAFDKDWKFDVEKAKEDELAWRAANPPNTSSDAWNNLFPSAVADCKVDPKKVKESTSKTDDWNAFSTIPSGDVMEDDCMSRLMIDAKVVIDPKTCSAAERTDFLGLGAAIDLLLGGRSTKEVAPSHDLAPRQDLVAVVFGVLEALRVGCLLDIIFKIILAIGIEAKIVAGPLGVLELVFDLLAILKL
jgi:hypothetical protein